MKKVNELTDGELVFALASVNKRIAMTYKEKKDIEEEIEKRYDNAMEKFNKG